MNLWQAYFWKYLLENFSFKTCISLLTLFFPVLSVHFCQCELCLKKKNKFPCASDIDSTFMRLMFLYFFFFFPLLPLVSSFSSTQPTKASHCSLSFLPHYCRLWLFSMLVSHVHCTLIHLCQFFFTFSSLCLYNTDFVV